MNKLKNTHDRSLVYAGGSGGFLMLHMLLLSGWQVGFRQNFSLDTILQKQWDVTQLGDWKASEICPDNQLTMQLPSPKLYFYCNPLANQQVLSEKIITIYTDIQSQIRLSRAKKAHWFYGTNSDFELQEFTRIREQHYSNVRDPEWPVLLTDASDQQLQEISSDPYWIQLESAGTWENLTISNSTSFNNVLVDPNIFSWLARSNEVVLLQDLVNTPHVVFSRLDLTFTDKHQQLLDRWISLHTKSLLESIGISC